MLSAVSVLATAATGRRFVIGRSVSYGQLAPYGPWELESPASSTGTFSFVNGPGTPPSGTGSLAMGIASGQHEMARATTPTAPAPAPPTVCSRTAGR